MGMDISVVIPVYGCRAALPELHRRLNETLLKLTESFEVILVDDCDKQNSWEDVKKIAESDPRFTGIHFSRNFGQIRAITAGLDHSKGDWVVVMDCDLQDRPESIIELYNKAQEGYDVVFAQRQDRVDSAVTKFLSRSFYKVYDYFTDGSYDPSISNFSISSRKVIDAYCRMREHSRAYTMFIKWLGFKQTAIPVHEDARFEGTSSYTFSKKMNMALDIISTQSVKPLRFSIRFGFFIAVVALIYILYILIRTLAVGDMQAGWPTMIASIWLLGGLILMAIGVSGLYIGNIFEETKGRPLYVISEVIEEGKEK
jgi:glycosyltransferase involved in cell wall biosynthesis